MILTVELEGQGHILFLVVYYLGNTCQNQHPTLLEGQGHSLFPKVDHMSVHVKTQG